MPQKRIKLCSRTTFGAQIHRTDPQNIGGQFRTLWGLFEKHFLEENEPKKAPKYIWDRKVSGIFFRNEHQLIP